MNVVLEKIAAGDGLTDNELKVALKFYKELSTGLELLGPPFFLAWREVYRVQNKLEGWQRSREESGAKRP
jgi:hypothetical protein